MGQINATLGVSMAHQAPLVVSPYSRTWPEEFESERQLIAASIPQFHFRLEHVGVATENGQ